MTVKASIARARAKQDNGFRPNPKTGLCDCEMCVETRRQEAENVAAEKAERARQSAERDRRFAEVIAESERRAAEYKRTGMSGLADRARAAIESVTQKSHADAYDEMMRRAHFDRTAR